MHLLKSLWNSDCRSREMLSEFHTQCQQIPRSSVTMHHKFEVYAMLTIKHRDEEHWTNI